MENFDTHFCTRQADRGQASSDIFPLVGLAMVFASAALGYGAIYYFLSLQ